MLLRHAVTVASVAVFLSAAPSAQAILVDRGGGMLYDNVMNVTWLQDANYAKTSGYCNTAGNCVNSDGWMTWTQANTWATNLNYGGYSSGWRLAKNSPVNGTTFNATVSVNGTTDRSWNITSTVSELSYMYYVNLNLKGYYNPNGSIRSDFGIFGDGTGGGSRQNNVGLVKNLQSDLYWAGTLSVAGAAWNFDTINGFQQNILVSNPSFAWAVRDGDVDVAAVPIPGSVALLAGGMALLGVVTRRRKAR